MTPHAVAGSPPTASRVVTTTRFGRVRRPARPATPPRARLTPINPLADDLNDDGPLARAVVEVDQHELLPGAERQAAAGDRDLLRGADQRGALVSVGIRVVVEAGVAGFAP